MTIVKLCYSYKCLTLAHGSNRPIVNLETLLQFYNKQQLRNMASMGLIWQPGAGRFVEQI